MTRFRAALVAALAGALGAAGAADAATYRGTVGPGRTIALVSSNGAGVTRVPAGRHTFVVRDRSARHNFVLSRAGATLRSTGIRATGTFRWRVRLSAGRYTVYCATHAEAMRRSFRVR